MSQTHRRQFIQTAALSGFALLSGCKKPDAGGDPQPPVLRIGFFPNLTHVQALIAYHETQTLGAEGSFEKATGARIEWYPFNAGPSAIEALLVGSVDVTYVGPSPVLNGYIRTKGRDIRVLTGAARGATALVVQPGSQIREPADFRGKKLATPQMGNTQDVAARAWLTAGGLKITQKGGDALVLPTQNPDQLELFKRKELDGVWTVEPWVSRLEIEAGAVPVVIQDDVLVTLIATSQATLKNRRPLLDKLLVAHQALTDRIVADPAAAKKAVSAALEKATSRPIRPELLDHAWPRLKLTTALNRADFESAMNDAHSVGLLPEKADLAQLFLNP
jgi:NitT/TauT family transport system substrate-binding protein